MTSLTKPIPTAADPTTSANRNLDTETADYVANWPIKYAAQIQALNKMVEDEGLWSDDLRQF
jgi:hypothetical protein